MRIHSFMTCVLTLEPNGTESNSVLLGMCRFKPLLDFEFPYKMQDYMQVGLTLQRASTNFY